MKRQSLIITFVSLLLLVAGIIPAAAQGIIVPDCPPPCLDCDVRVPCWTPGVFTDPSWLKIDFHRVNVTVEDQIATTNVDMQFTNVGESLAEGTFIFPLPQGATVDQLIMYVDGQAIEARILEADEARAVYDEIVRQYRDPALLEYIGTGAVQANIFPIPPGDFRRVEISYVQILEIDNGLIHYVYPMNTAHVSGRTIDEMSVSVDVQSNDEISNIYSPSHEIAISRDGDDGFSAGYESNNFRPDGDFSLYWGISSDEINVNLLTFREGANDNGFFMLLVQPPVEVPDDQLFPKDVIIVLDQSGSMDGDKWQQAQDAAAYVLENLNPEDHFNVVLFSTGYRTFSNEMETPAEAQEAIDWIYTQDAIGGTDINLALTTALDMVGERPATILFMTDGLPTEGETEIEGILENVENAAPSNASIFAFGVGDDVDTFLLDTIVQANNGISSYVRPSERIDEEMASLYNKINAPVLTDIEIDFGDLMVEDMYPAVPLPDLFAGSQITLVGRYRGDADDTSITLRGEVNGEPQSFTYSSLDFPERAGGEPFIARLWATRRIGDLLQSIRLNGENPEIVESIVDLSVRYGIITPYTSFLIDENDILSQQGRADAAANFEQEAQTLASEAS
ncbi:MAG: VWA domain-containing protein, partial [Burkholderiales bacterium]|nr:VWA domain-containing protein [Anaerolineae bacterium]